MSGLAPSPEEEKKMAAMIEGMQTRDSLRMYNNLVEKCFSTCVQSFRRKTLEKDEERCVSKCCEKFLKHSSRVACVRRAQRAEHGADAAAAAVRGRTRNVFFDGVVPS